MKAIIKRVRVMKEKVVNIAAKVKWQAVVLIYALLIPLNRVYAATAEDKWNDMIDFLVPWITRLGGIVLLIGVVEFGLAFKSDDAEGKTKGMRTAIAGCIVFAVGLSSSIFLY